MCSCRVAAHAHRGHVLSFLFVLDAVQHGPSGNDAVVRWKNGGGQISEGFFPARQAGDEPEQRSALLPVRGRDYLNCKRHHEVRDLLSRFIFGDRLCGSAILCLDVWEVFDAGSGGSKGRVRGILAAGIGILIREEIRLTTSMPQEWMVLGSAIRAMLAQFLSPTLGLPTIRTVRARVRRGTVRVPF